MLWVPKNAAPVAATPVAPKILLTAVVLKKVPAT